MKCTVVTGTPRELAKLAIFEYAARMAGPHEQATKLLHVAEADERILHFLLRHLDKRGHLDAIKATAYKNGRRHAWEKAFHHGLAARDGFWREDLPQRGQRSREAVAFLQRELADGQEVEASEMLRRAKAEHIAERTLNRVRPQWVEYTTRAENGQRATYWRLRTSANVDEP